MNLFSRTLTSALEGTPLLVRHDIDHAVLRQRYWQPSSRRIELPGGLGVHYVDSLCDPEPKADTSSCRTHTTDTSTAKPVLLMVHGLLMDHYAWHAWHDCLCDTFRIIALDLPGHGLTDAPGHWPATIEHYADLLHEFIAALRLEHVTLVGHSMGGNIAWTFALKYPHSLDSLVLIAASGWLDTSAQAQRIQSFLHFAGSAMGKALLRRANLEGLVQDGMRDTFTPHPVPTGLVERYATLACATGHRDILLNIAHSWGQRTLADERRLATLDVPTLIMIGDRDRLVPAEHAYLFADAIKGSELIVYPRNGHIPMMTIPQASAADLRQWLLRTHC